MGSRIFCFSKGVRTREWVPQERQNRPGNEPGHSLPTLAGGGGPSRGTGTSRIIHLFTIIILSSRAFYSFFTIIFLSSPPLQKKRDGKEDWLERAWKLRVWSCGLSKEIGGLVLQGLGVKVPENIYCLGSMRIGEMYALGSKDPNNRGGRRLPKACKGPRGFKTKEDPKKAKILHQCEWPRAATRATTPKGEKIDRRDGCVHHMWTTKKTLESLNNPFPRQVLKGPWTKGSLPWALFKPRGPSRSGDRKKTSISSRPGGDLASWWARAWT